MAKRPSESHSFNRSLGFEEVRTLHKYAHLSLQADRDPLPLQEYIPLDQRLKLTKQGGNPSESEPPQHEFKPPENVVAAVQKGHRIRAIRDLLLPPVLDFLRYDRKGNPRQNGRLDLQLVSGTRRIENTVREAEQWRAEMEEQYRTAKQRDETYPSRPQKKAKVREEAILRPELSENEEKQVKEFEQRISDLAMTGTLDEQDRAMFNFLNTERMPLIKLIAASRLVEIRCEKVQAKANEMIEAASDDINEWINAVFLSFDEYLKECKENRSQTSAALESEGRVYADDNLYVIMTPEFAINGQMRRNKRHFWASYPAPAQLERRICRLVHQTLRERYRNLRVLFVFSCATYTVYNNEPKDDQRPIGPAAMLYQVTITNEGELERPDTQTSERKLAASNKITVLTSTDHPPKYIAKWVPSDNDGWEDYNESGTIFSVPDVTDHEQTLISDSRREAVKLTFECFGEEDRCFSFGTCLDIMHDEPQEDVNMLILVGGGTPLERIRKGLQPLPFNDTLSWDSSNGEVYKAGVYYFEHDLDRCAELKGRGFQSFWETFQHYLRTDPSRKDDGVEVEKECEKNKDLLQKLFHGECLGYNFTKTDISMPLQCMTSSKIPFPDKRYT